MGWSIIGLSELSPGEWAMRQDDVIERMLREPEQAVSPENFMDLAGIPCKIEQLQQFAQGPLWKAIKAGVESARLNNKARAKDAVVVFDPQADIALTVEKSMIDPAELFDRFATPPPQPIDPGEYAEMLQNAVTFEEYTRVRDSFVPMTTAPSLYPTVLPNLPSTYFSENAARLARAGMPIKTPYQPLRRPLKKQQKAAAASRRGLHLVVGQRRAYFED